MRKILCFGNEFLEEDKQAIELAREMKVKGFEFIICDSPEEIVNYTDVIILDVAEGISKVTLLDVKNVQSNPVAMHDLDLGFFLKLSKELGKPKKVKIIALPQKGKKEEIKQQLLEVLKSI